MVQGSFTDNDIQLSGVDNIIGRGFMLTSSLGLRVAVCVFGVSEDADPTFPNEGGPNSQVIAASAVMLATSLNNYDRYAAGLVQLSMVSGSNNVRLRYYLNGLPPGQHQWHIHIR